MDLRLSSFFATVKTRSALPFGFVVDSPGVFTTGTVVSVSADTLFVVLLAVSAVVKFSIYETIRDGSAGLSVASELLGVRKVVGPKAVLRVYLSGASAGVRSVNFAGVAEFVDSPVSANLVDVGCIVFLPSVMAFRTSLFAISKVLGCVSNNLFGFFFFDNRVAAGPPNVLNLQVGCALTIGVDAGGGDIVVGTLEVGADRHCHLFVLELASERLKVLGAVLLDDDGVVALSEDGLYRDKLAGLAI